MMYREMHVVHQSGLQGEGGQGAGEGDETSEEGLLRARR